MKINTFSARFFLTSALVAIAAFFIFGWKPADKAGDQARYATLGLNLADHGVFSSITYDPNVTPRPTLAWAGPLVAPEIALAVLISPESRRELTCLATSNPNCDIPLSALRAIHLVELLVFLGCQWWLAFLILNNEMQAWLVTFVALGFKEVTFFSTIVMTEPLFLCAYGVFAAILTTASVREKGLPWWALAGVFLGFATLAKPTCLPLLAVVPSTVLALAIARKQSFSDAARRCAVLMVAASLIVAPWMLRSFVLFGNLQLTDPSYLEASLSHRLAYDRMTWMEWAVGWIYFLPDFGDNLVRRIWGATALEGLGWGPESYYHYGANVLVAQARAIATPGSATEYLVTTYIVGDPLKFLAVSALLTWRGVFVGTYLGIAGIIATVPALRGLRIDRAAPLVLFAASGFALAIIQGCLSVSIPRYNLALVPVYAVSIVWFADQGLKRWRGTDVLGPRAESGYGVGHSTVSLQRV